MKLHETSVIFLKGAISNLNLFTEDNMYYRHMIHCRDIMILWWYYVCNKLT